MWEPFFLRLCNYGFLPVHTLEAAHDKSYVHGDIKLDNIILPMNGKLTPYLVDFGHTRHKGTEGAERSLAVGTLPFMSVNAHKEMCELAIQICCSLCDILPAYGRRDDILSLVYTLIYLYHGTLPWYHCKDADQCLKLDFEHWPQLDTGLRSLLQVCSTSEHFSASLSF